MATPGTVLYRYRWATAAVGAAVVAGGLVWLLNRPGPVETAPQETVATVSETAVEAEPVEVAAAEPATAAEPAPAVETEPAPETAVTAEPAPVVAEQAPVMEAATEPAPAESAEESEPTEETAAAEVPATEDTATETGGGATLVAEAPVAEDTAAEAGDEATAVAEAPAATIPEVEVTAAATATEDGAGSPQVAPSLDVVRVEPGGSAVVAGRAEPNAQVDIAINGEEVASAQANEKGEFVAFVETGSEPGAETIQAVSETDGGVDLVSADTVLVLTPEMPEGEEVAPAVVSATEAGVTVLQPGGLAIPDQVSLDSISYDKAGEAILAGRAQPLSEVRIYVDDIFAVSATASDSGAWSTPLNQVAAGRYILRVDEIGPDGAVTSRAETPFQKEYPENIAPYLQMANGKLTVQPGNTLWVMAREIYGSGIQYTQIFQANKDSIRDPDLIYPGQIFNIPENPPQ